MGFSGYMRSKTDSELARAGSDVDSYHSGVYCGRRLEVGVPDVLDLNLDTGFPIDRDTALRGTGLDLELAENTMLSLDHEGQLPPMPKSIPDASS